MKKNYSKRFKMFIEKPSKLASNRVKRILSILLIIVSVIVGLGMYQEERQEEQAEYSIEDRFDPFNDIVHYGYVDVEIMSDPFASNYDDSVFYYFVADENYYLYVVAVREDQQDIYNDIIEYTYNDIEKVEDISVYGISEEITDDLFELAVEPANYFMGTDLVTIDNIHEYVGFYFIDTTVLADSGYELTILFAILVFAFLYTLIMIYVKNHKANKSIQRILDQYDVETLSHMDQDMNREDTLYLSKQRIAITHNHLFTCENGLDIIPLESIKHVYSSEVSKKLFSTSRFVFHVETKNGDVYTIYSNHYMSKFEKVSQVIIDSLKSKVEELEVGVDGQFIPFKLNRFLSVDTLDKYEEKESNVVLGVIGSVVGALIGSILWVVLARIGYIAGLAGFVMLILSVMGYRICSGHLNNYGQKVCVWVVSIVIAFVHPISYMMDYLEYNSLPYSVENLIQSFIQLPSFLTETDNWPYFIFNLVVGYIVFIVVSSRVIKEIFRKKDMEA